MRNTWFLFVAPIILFATIVMVLFVHRKKKTKKKTTYRPLANTKMTRDLPEYAKARKKYHLLLVGVVVLFLLAFGSTAVLIARPVSVSVAKPEYNTRDIMLCLDVSGSMYRYIGHLSTNFIEMVNKLEGQRVGITIFDGEYMNLIPLSDDYDVIVETLEELKTDFSQYSSAIQSVQSSVSEIGPGLVGCVNGFDKLDEEERMRAIILATDNYASSTQAVNILQAANYAKRYNILTYGLSISDLRPQSAIESINTGKGSSSFESSNLKEYREAMINTGGSYFAIGSDAQQTAGGGGPDAPTDNKYIKEIVNSILAQTSARFDGAGTLIREDSTLIPTIVLIVSILLFFLIIWRLGI